VARVLKRVFVVILMAAVLAGCGLFGSGREGERFARPGEPKASPSGDFIVSVDMGPVQNGVETWIPVIRDNATGAEVFRDTDAYSSRHGVGITWLSTDDQLWLLSGDVGTAHIDRQPSGTWTKTGITPETRNDIPDEIAALDSH
jgi:hypothetical protein